VLCEVWTVSNFSQVKDFPTLVESLKAYVSAERLTDANRYDCFLCDSKQDALRALALRKIPPVLSISLNRFEYDKTTWQRVKAGRCMFYMQIVANLRSR
jgi:ubiquitin C-terminal hydrolase